MKTEVDEDFLFGKATEEIDIPVNTPDNTETTTKKLEFEEREKEKARHEKRYFSAFKLIIGCLIFLGIIYVIDVVCSVFLMKELSQITDSIIEIIKTLLFTLSGYLFARKNND